jgi:hypothetical protein
VKAWPWIMAAVFGLYLLAAGCSKQAGEPTMFTGKVLTAADIRGALDVTKTGSAAYAEVNSKWVEWYYPKFRDALSAGAYGITKWDGAFKCTAFTTSLVGDVQMKFFAQSFHAEIVRQTQTAAAAQFWYYPEGQTTIGHALAEFRTENPAKRFFEPQTGKWVTLTPAEQSAGRVYLRTFN